MSGSTRAITLTLSVRDADQVRQQLVSMGEAGEAALGRLDAAAQRAAGRGGGGGAGGGGVAGLGQTITQAGFQVQDFFVQIQGGTSALTALSQQGSQFLGVFGPGGAIAGAVLAVGALGASFLTTGESAEQAQKRMEANFNGMEQAAKDVATVLREINQLFLTGAEASAAAANRQQQQLTEDARRLLDVTIQRNEANSLELQQAQRELDRQERIAAAESGGVARMDSPLFAARARVAGLQQDMARQSARIGELQAALTRVQNLPQVDPTLPLPPRFADEPTPSGGGANRAEAAARRLRELDLASEERGDAAAIRDLDQALRAVETPLERHFRQIQELGELQARLREAGSPMSESDTDRLIEGYDRQLEEAERRAARTDDTAKQLGLTFSSAFEDAIVKGKDLQTVLKGIEADLARIIIRKAITEPLANAVGGLNLGSIFSSLATSIFGGTTASAAGNIFAGGNVIPFANGGVVGGPTFFPMPNGTGLMGEAGPEGIFPLRRNSRGQLGIMAEGGGGMVVNQNFSIDARGADAGVDQKIRAGIAVAVEQANARLLAQINRGGSVAKTVGRRA